MTPPERLSPDPSVALVAYRFEAESEGPQRVHDVALMLGEAPEDCEASRDGLHASSVRGEGRVVCLDCGLVLRFWTCDCQDATYRERICRHIEAAKVLYAEERRAARWQRETGGPPPARDGS